MKPGRANREMVTPALLREMLSYDEATGLFIWKERRDEHFPVTGYPIGPTRTMWNKRFAGRSALCDTGTRGYRTGTIFGHCFKAHRVAWAIVHGEWPVASIDHINGDVADNRICNLRSVDQFENQKNQKRRSDNKSGVTGVSQLGRLGRWRAEIWTGRSEFLGYFPTKEAAAAARKAAESRLGFHENHGRVAIGGGHR